MIKVLEDTSTSRNESFILEKRLEILNIVSKVFMGSLRNEENEKY